MGPADHHRPGSATERRPGRRRDEPVSFDRTGRCLRLGSTSVRLSEGAGNTAVLEAYVDLVGRCRGVRPVDLPQVRDVDLAALADALDLDAGDLEAEVQALLGADAPEARSLVARLRDHRVVTGIAAAALTATIAGVVVYGGGGSGPTRPSPGPGAPARSTATAGPARTTVAPVPQVGPEVDAPTDPGAPIAETPDGVGLIPALELDGDGVGLIASTTTEQPAPGP